MVWTINFSELAVKQLKKLDKQEWLKIFNYLETHVYINPRQQGKALAYNKSGLWRYRVGNYRIICQLKNEIVTIIVVSVGHRKEVYR